MRPARLALAIALLAGTAHASPFQPPGNTNRRIIGVLEINAPTPEVANAFETQLQAKLDIKRFWIAPRAKMKERLASSTKWVEGCVVGLCLTEAKVQTGATLVVLAALTGSGTSFGYAVTLVRTDTGRVLSQKADRCDVCTMSEAMTAATAATAKLLDDVPNQLPDEAAEAGAAVDVAVSTSKKQQAHERKQRRTTGIVMTAVGLGFVVAGTAAYLLQDSRPAYGITAAGAGGGLAIGGIVVLF